MANSRDLRAYCSLGLINLRASDRDVDNNFLSSLILWKYGYPKARGISQDSMMVGKGSLVACVTGRGGMTYIPVFTLRLTTWGFLNKPLGAQPESWFLQQRRASLDG